MGVVNICSITADAFFKSSIVSKRGTTPILPKSPASFASSSTSSIWLTEVVILIMYVWMAWGPTRSWAVWISRKRAIVSFVASEKLSWAVSGRWLEISSTSQATFSASESVR